MYTEIDDVLRGNKPSQVKLLMAVMESNVNQEKWNQIIESFDKKQPQYKWC